MLRRITIEEYAAAVGGDDRKVAAFRTAFGDFVHPMAYVLRTAAGAAVVLDEYVNGTSSPGPAWTAYAAATDAPRKKWASERRRVVVEAMPKLRRLDYLYYTAQAALSAMDKSPQADESERLGMLHAYVDRAASPLADLGAAILAVDAEFNKEIADAVEAYFEAVDA